jgi:filamentous hemagglutinin family protein
MTLLKVRLQCRRYLLSFFSCLPVWSVALYGSGVRSQILPDGSLGNETSTIESNTTTDLIGGGAVRGSNLFHSFLEFNLGEGQEVYFAAPPGIANIFSRVTGGNPSEILGKLGVNGTANLFLLNPNGIIFGQNSSLDVAGSFVATTADRIIFPDNFVFSASNLATPPLLTVNLPIGLQFGSKAESIVNRSQHAVNFFGSPSEVGLQVPRGKSIALIGGEILFQGGFLTAPVGSVTLGAVGKNSSITLQPTEKGWNFSYQNISEFQDIKFSSNGLKSNIESSRSNIDISDFDDLNPSKTGGEVRLQGRNIIFADGSQINAANLVTTSDGLILINAAESVQIIGTGSYISYVTVGNGRGGNIEINAKKLLLAEGGSIFVETLRFILDEMPQPLAEGQAGRIIINTSELVELSGAIISGSTSTKGDAGNIEITTDRLILRDGSIIEAVTRPKSPDFSESEGDGGSIIINARAIDLLDGGSIIVDSQATGRGGDIKIETEILYLDDGGKITANSFGNDGGNISLNVSKILELRRQSEISTNAGETIGGGDGGNIDIDAQFIVAVPTENSDISADAFAGNGGNITIDTESLFGIAYRDEDTRLSDLTAFSRNKFAINGTVIINSPDVDPSQSLDQLKEGPQVPQLARDCQTEGDFASRFVNIGRGGLPIDPYEPLSSRSIIEDLRLPKYWSQSINLSEETPRIVEAKGLQRDDRGNLVLVGAEDSSFTCP